MIHPASPHSAAPWGLLLLAALVLVPARGAFAEAASPRPPVAAKRPHPMTLHGVTRVDDYYWLRDDSRSNPEVLDYLAAENAYTAAVLAPTDALQEKLYQELVGRLKQDDDTVPYRKHGDWFYRRYLSGQEYSLIARRRGSLTAPEEILLDLNARAAGHDFYALGDWAVTTDGRRLAWSEDTVSRRRYTLRVKDLTTGELLPDVIENTSGDVVWANDGRTLFYIEKHPVTLLGYKVRRHLLGSDPANDPVVHEEQDTAFYTNLFKTRSDRYLGIFSRSTVSTEVRLLDAERPDGEFRVFLPRERDHEYSVEDLGDRFVVRTNWQAKNFRLVLAPAGNPADRAAWKDLVAHRDDVLIEDFAAFHRHVVVAERSAGLRRLRIKPLDGSAEHYVTADEPAYSAWLDVNPEQATETLRYGYSSLVTPDSIFELDLATGERKLLKRDVVLGGFAAENYQSERLFLPARDGAQVPVSVLYRRGTPLDGTAPLLLYAYGSYGYSTDPDFDANVLSLVDRGFVYAIAHVRGGQEMGRSWYEDGKLHKKKNTFYDFIDVAEGLAARHYAARDRLFAAGGSAGGLLVGAVVELRPDLWRGAIAGVPFVDVVTTMLDASIPLTSNEWDEWGDPRRKADFDYMLSYSPYDQVSAKAYPNLLVTTGLWDSQVQYYEPAKWVAKLRARKTDANWLLLKTNMEAGHGGKSGRFQRLREKALQYAFLLELAGRRG